MRRLPWIWLLPLLLLLGQYGQFRHELDHYTRAAADQSQKLSQRQSQTQSQTQSRSQSQKQRPADADRCELCLAYGHLSAAVKAEAAAPGLRADLGYHCALERLHQSADPALPAARNRGPPAV